MIWTPNLAYIVGLIATDGNLSKDGRHLTLVSKDYEQLTNFIGILNLKCPIMTKRSSYNPNGSYFYIQFSSVKLYKFLNEIGLTPNKSRTIGGLSIPSNYFIDFLRGHLDGDGCTYSYYDKRWKNSFMLYTVFISASSEHLVWISNNIQKLYNLKGQITTHRSVYHLRYAKKVSIILLKKIYYSSNLICLSRKRFKIEQALSIISKQAGMLKLVNRLP